MKNIYFMKTVVLTQASTLIFSGSAIVILILINLGFGIHIIYMYAVMRSVFLKVSNFKLT